MRVPGSWLLGEHRLGGGMTKRRALIVGIDEYNYAQNLHGCVNDAEDVADLLKKHGDGLANFGRGLRLLTAKQGSQGISRRQLKENVEWLFQHKADVALLYFSGHGHTESTGGYLVTSDSRSGDEGLPLANIMSFINSSPAAEKIVLLDSCYSGKMANTYADHVELSEGTVILTASTDVQLAIQEGTRSVFTSLLCDGLRGSAADLLGNVTPAALYTHVDQSLGGWSQRPMFKANVQSFVSLRNTEPPIELKDLRKINRLFPEPDFVFELDPSYEGNEVGKSPGMAKANKQNVSKFSVLQKLNRVNLVVPKGAPHMWDAAVGSKACVLTPLGQHYWRMRDDGSF